MRTIKIIFIVTFLMASAGFINFSDSSANENSGADKITVSKDAKPSLTSVDFSDLGNMIASWYGPKFHGKLTANGEIYNQMAFTAAHKELPFGTFLRITNIRNGKSVVVRINDRGPFIDGRDLDLSKGTALALGMIQKGVIRVKVEELSASEEINPVTLLN